MDANTQIARPNLDAALAMAAGFAAAGLRHAVISPGSRTTPLTLALLSHPDIQVWVHVDERSAAFFALGLAKATGMPAVLACTSGSAPANWYPAVVEADSGRVPMVLVSTDRPAELRGWGANQTTDQQHLFAGHARSSHCAAQPGPAVSARYYQQLAARSVHESRAALMGAGPVHINLPFGEPVLPDPLPADLALTQTTNAAIAIFEAARMPSPTALHTLAEQLSGQRGVIVCGQGNYPPGFARDIAALACKLDVPVLAEPLSGLRFGAHDRSRICCHQEAFLRASAFTARHEPEWVLRFGAFPVARTLSTWLAGLADTRHLLVAGDTAWPDPLHRTSLLLDADASAVAAGLLSLPLQAAPAGWCHGFIAAEERSTALAKAALDDGVTWEAALIADLVDLLPEGHTFFCGNSMAIRDLDTFSGSSGKALRLIGSRGVSGIDGNLSTAAGIAAAAGPTAVLLGDLACLHDLNGLAAMQGRDLLAIVVNNGGGGIFEYLGEARLPRPLFERAWLATPDIDYAHAARAFSIPFLRCSERAAFRDAVAGVLARGGPHLIEVRIDRADSVARHRRYWSAVTASLGD